MNIYDIRVVKSKKKKKNNLQINVSDVTINYSRCMRIMYRRWFRDDHQTPGLSSSYFLLLKIFFQ
jgi:hypothetical protein